MCCAGNKYSYDSLNRLKQVHEDTGVTSYNWQQAYNYDRWGNRTIDQANTSNVGIPTWNFGVDPNTNRLAAPGGWTMSYDNAGNLTNDTYTGQGPRAYDAENRMITANNGADVYTYDGEGHRVKRNISSTETWQVYGVGGELLAEYPAGANPLTTPPQKEYGYRNGQLLITAESGSGSSAGPSSLAAAPYNDNGLARVTLNWSVVSGATNYRVERATNKDGPYVFVGHSSSISLIDTEIKIGVRPAICDSYRGFSLKRDHIDSSSVGRSLNQLSRPRFGSTRYGVVIADRLLNESTGP